MLLSMIRAGAGRSHEPVGLAGLEAFGRQPKVGADARHGHQPPADLVSADDVAHPLVEDGELVAECRPGEQQRLEDVGQSRVAGHRLPDAGIPATPEQVGVPP